MLITNDMYDGLSKLTRWYDKYQKQIIEISGTIGTGVWELIQLFFDQQQLDPREVMYLSYDQRQVLELASKRYHAYYINSRIYNYTRYVDFDTLPVISPSSVKVESQWKKTIKRKIPSNYKMIVVFDSLLLNEGTLHDLSSFGVPMILIRDPMLLPAPDTCMFLKDAKIQLREIHPDYTDNPLVYFAHKILYRERLKEGTYGNVSIISRRHMNLYNLKSNDMTITMTEQIRNDINTLYRERISKSMNYSRVGERLIVTNSMHHHRLVNQDEKKIKVYLTRGVVGHITRIYKHATSTRYVPMEFQPDFYHEAFTDLILDRYTLNHIEAITRQMTPDEIFQVEYAYALTPSLCRVNHWDRVMMIVDPSELPDEEFETRSLYTAITRARQSLTIVI